MLGSCLCLFQDLTCLRWFTAVIMFLISWSFTVVSLALASLIYYYVSIKGKAGDWGDGFKSAYFQLALRSLRSLGGSVCPKFAVWQSLEFLSHCISLVNIESIMCSAWWPIMAICYEQSVLLLSNILSTRNLVDMFLVSYLFFLLSLFSLPMCACVHACLFIVFDISHYYLQLTKCTQKIGTQSLLYSAGHGESCQKMFPAIPSLPTLPTAWRRKAVGCPYLSLY